MKGRFAKAMVAYLLLCVSNGVVDARHVIYRARVALRVNWIEVDYGNQRVRGQNQLHCE
jgi:hypothetical protein